MQKLSDLACAEIGHFDQFLKFNFCLQKKKIQRKYRPSIQTLREGVFVGFRCLIARRFLARLVKIETLMFLP